MIAPIGHVLVANWEREEVVLQRKSAFALIECFVLIALIALAAWFTLSSSAARLPAESGHAAPWDRRAAAAYLDERTSGWMHNMGAIDHGTFCISCHTGLP